MDIKSFLLELIATQKTVGIHALGTLYKKKTPGRYDSETHSFLPPKQEIAFSTTVSEDRSLVNFISEKKNISVESAAYYVNEFVEGIQAQLADHQYVDFSPFGELKNVGGEVVFESSKSLDHTFDFYGLPNVPAKVEENPVQESTPEAQVEHQEPDNFQAEEEKDIEIQTENLQNQAFDIVPPLHDEIVELNLIQEQNELEERVDSETKSELPTSESEPSISDPLWKPTVLNRYEYDEEDEEDENSGRWIRVLLKAIFIILIVSAIAGALLYFFYPDLFYTIKGNFSKSTIEESIPLLKTDTSAAPSTDTTLLDTINTAAATIPIITHDSTVVYEVIGSAMKTQKKADEMISILSKRGINAKKIDVMPGRRIKISLGTFIDLSLAKKFQDSLKIKLRNPEIYILTIKPKN